MGMRRPETRTLHISKEKVKKLATMQSKGDDKDTMESKGDDISSVVFDEVGNVVSHDCYWKGLARVLYLHLRDSQKREADLPQDKEQNTLGCPGQIEKQLWENIQRIESLLQLVLKDVLVCIAYCDANLECKYIKWPNGSASVLKCEDILGKRDSELVNVIPGALELMEIKRRVLTSGIAERRELAISFGEVRWIVVVCEPYLVDGKIEGVITVSIDETAEVAMKNKKIDMEKWENTEEELRRAIQYANEAVKAQNEYLAVMSHEIRTPLTGVLGMAQVLAATQLDAEQKEMVDAMVFSGDVLLSIISDVLDLSKMESGTMKLEDVEYDPREIVKHVAKTAAPSAKVKIITDVSRDVPRKVVGDPVKLQQVLSNLVFNAQKFTQDGYVLVKIGVVEAGDEDKGASSKDGEVCLKFAVEDTGIGIPDESIGSVFQKYTQAHTSSPQKYGGTGLGLAICKQLVELMGGRINVSSCVGQGSTFSFSVCCGISDSQHEEVDKITEGASTTTETLSFPPSEAKPVVAETCLQSDEGLSKTSPRFDYTRITKTQRPRMLLVEDNKVNAMVIVSMLKKLGLTPDVASDGEEAIKDIQAKQYDLVFMDVCMPVLDGLEVTRRIRNFERTGSWEEGAEESSGKQHPRLPVIAMTASAVSDCEAQCKEIGMDGYISKPISLKKLQGVLEEFFPEFAEEIKT